MHTALLVANALTGICVFGLARHLLGGAAAAVAVGSFALLSLSYGVQGAFANAEHFVLLFAVPSLWLLLLAAEREQWLGCGIAGLGLGLALLVKQQGAAFALCGGLWLLWTELRRRPRRASASATRVACFGAAVAAPLLGVAALYAAIGAFDDLWFWTVEYALTYAGAEPEVLLFVRARSSWLRRPDSSKQLERWFQTYRLGYDLVGHMEIHPRASRFHTGVALANLTKVSPTGISIYQRKAAGDRPPSERNRLRLR